MAQEVLPISSLFLIKFSSTNELVMAANPIRFARSCRWLMRSPLLACLRMAQVPMH